MKKTDRDYMKQQRNRADSNKLKYYEKHKIIEDQMVIDRVEKLDKDIELPNF